MRTDLAWIHALDAIHHPWPKLAELPDKSYDLGIIIIMDCIMIVSERVFCKNLQVSYFSSKNAKAKCCKFKSKIVEAILS